MIEVNKYKKSDRTPIIIPVVTVDLYQDTGVIINDKPFKKYIKTLEFFDYEEFEQFKARIWA